MLLGIINLILSCWSCKFSPHGRASPMRCIFCKQNSDGSKSIEHIVPHSFGNNRAILCKGMVCDKCNNYFARKIEQPLLADRSFRNLRAMYQVPNKRGRPPSLQGLISGTELEVGLRLINGEPVFEPEREGDIEAIRKHLVEDWSLNNSTEVIFEIPMEPPKALMSRLLAKMAMEMISLRMASQPSHMESFIDDPYWDYLRRWARVGDNCDEWPYSHRQVMPTETYMSHPDTGEWVRAGYSIDLFVTRRRETYMAFMYYGHEFVLNCGGPSIKGYAEWLEQHCNISPLIERLGNHLKVDIATSPPTTYIVGNSELEAGIKFDIAQGIDGIDDAE